MSRVLIAIKEFLSNPWIGGIGTVVGIVSLFLYFSGKQSRHLEFNLNPAKAIVVKAGQASKLAVSYGGSPINSDITAAQIALWNQGNLSIKPDNILQPIAIVVDGAQILEATIRKNSRSVTALKLDSSEVQKGRLGVSWQILEHGDGALIQVIYTGTPEANVRVEGVIEGQGIIGIKSFNYGSKFLGILPENTTVLVMSVLYVLVGVLATYVGKNSTLRLRRLGNVTTVMGIAIFAYWLWLYSTTAPDFVGTH